MSTQQKEPKRDWGFYGCIPRIVRVGYKQLTHAEKYFYGCLKDLCGDDGACFRSLRKLEVETDISIGSLTPMIHHLHDAGLIHAEKKIAPRGTREIWYITIVDIWGLNAKYCAKKSEQSECSENEHREGEGTGQCSNSEQGTASNVQNLNISEHRTDVQCSKNLTRRIRDTDKGTIEEERDSLDAANADITPPVLPTTPSPELSAPPPSNLPLFGEENLPPQQEKSALPIAATTLDQRRKFWQERIVNWRGGLLPTKGGCITETNALKSLFALGYTDAQIDAILRVMLTKWPYKNDPRSIGAKEILSQAGPVSGTLKDRNCWPDETVSLVTPVEVTSLTPGTGPSLRIVTPEQKILTENSKNAMVAARTGVSPYMAMLNRAVAEAGVS